MALISCYLLYTPYVTFTTETEFHDCGKVVSRSTQLDPGKYTVSTDYYLGVQFDNYGFKAMNTTPGTYMKHNKGDRVCFSIHNPPKGITSFNFFIGIIMTCALLFALLILIIAWIFNLKIFQ